MIPVAATAIPASRSGQRNARGAEPATRTIAAPNRGSQRTIGVADVLDAEPIVQILLRQHLDLDQGPRQRVVIGFDERLPADAEIDCRRPAHADVERLGALERVGVLVDVDVLVCDRQAAQVPKGSLCVFAPVGAVDGNHWKL